MMQLEWACFKGSLELCQCQEDNWIFRWLWHLENRDVDKF